MSKMRIIFFAFLLSLGFLSFHDTHECDIDSQIISDRLESKIVGRSVEFKVYLPKNEKNIDKTYPVLYLLHGHGGNEKNWFEKEQGNIPSLLDSLRCIKKVPPIVAITFDAGNSWYVDSKEAMESFFLNEFIPYIESKYPIDGAKGRYIAGNSAGGYGSLRFSLLRPNLFECAILLSPASYEPLPPSLSSSRKVEAFALNGVFNDSIWHSYSYTKLWDSFIKSKEKPKFYLSAGDDDAYNIAPVVTAIQQVMKSQKVQNELRISNGGHDWTCWRYHITDALVSIFSEGK